MTPSTLRTLVAALGGPKLVGASMLPPITSQGVSQWQRVPAWHMRRFLLLARRKKVLHKGKPLCAEHLL